MQIRKFLAVSLLVLASAGVTVGLIGSRDAEALPNSEVYQIYYYDEARTQYAGEELLLSCHGAVHQMIDGVRAPYFVKTQEACQTGSWKSTCFKCNAPVIGFPHLPVCYQATAVNCWR